MTPLALLVPRWDFGERHAVAAPPEALEHVGRVTFADLPLVRLLFRLRGLPTPAGPVWEALLAVGFRPAAEHVLLQERGRFTFALAFWWEDGRLETETRVVAASGRARRLFVPYWLAVRPFSGLIRRLWLKAAVRAARKA